MPHKHIAILAITLTALASVLAFDPHLALDYLGEAGPAQATLFFLIYVASAVLLIPGSILTLAAGFIFGMVGGLALVSASSTAGALTAFLVGRHLAREFVVGRLGDSPKLQALDSATSESGFVVVLLTRLSPLFPYNVTNYAFSLTGVRTRDYALASWLGMLPATALYVSIGATTRSIGELSASSDQASPARLGLLILGLFTTLVVTTLIARRARARLAPLDTSTQDQTPGLAAPTGDVIENSSST